MRGLRFWVVRRIRGTHHCVCSLVGELLVIIIYKLSAMDVLVPNSMKDAANCDKQCELQKSVNHQTSERIRHYETRSQSVFGSVSLYFLIKYLVTDVDA